jgi:TP901 family phage tail tape measure protein
VALEAVLSGVVEIKGVGPAAASLGGLGRQIQMLGTISPAAASKLSGVERALYNVGQASSKTGSFLSKYVSVPLGLIGAAAVGMAVKFDQSFARIQGLAGRTGYSMDQMKQKVLDLARASGQGPQELADALYFVASAGLKASEVFPVLEASAKGAEIGMGDVGQIAQTLTGLLNAYAGTGLSAGKAMNIMTAAVKDGKAEMSDFATGLGPVIAVAANAGVSFNELGAALAVATDLSVSFDRAVTGMRFLIQSVSNPTHLASKALADFGINAGDLAGEIKSRGLIPVLQDLYDKLYNSGEAGRKAWNAIVGGARGAIVAVDLVGKHTAFTNGIVRDLGAAAQEGATNFKDAFGSIVKNDPAIQFQKTIASIKADLITLGNDILPIVNRVLGYIDRAAKAFSHLSPAMQDNIVKWGLIAVAAGPALRILGGAIGIFIKLRTAMSGAGAAKDALAANVATKVPGMAGIIRLFGRTATEAFLAYELGSIKTSGLTDAMHHSLEETFPKAASLIHQFGVESKAGQAAVEGLALAFLHQWTGVTNASEAWKQYLGYLSHGRGREVEPLTDALLKLNVVVDGNGRAWSIAGISYRTGTDDLKAAAAAARDAKSPIEQLGASEVHAGGKARTMAQRIQAALHLSLSDFKTWRAGVEGNLFGAEAAMSGLSSKAHVTAADIVKAFNNSVASQAKLKHALQVLAARGFPAELAQQFLDMGAQGVQGLIALARGSKSQTDKVIGDFKRTQGQADDVINKIFGIAGAIRDIPTHWQTDYDFYYHIHGSPPGQGYRKAEGGVRRLAMGGVLRAQSGLIARSPTMLEVGEGKYGTAFGRGAEAILPLDSRGIGILAKAMELAMAKSNPRGHQGDGQPPVVVPVIFRDQFDHEWQRAARKSVTRRLSG